MAFIEADGSSFSGTKTHSVWADICSNGPTLECSWHVSDGRLEVRSDRLGFIPIFYWHGGSRLVVSDSLAELAARLPQRRFDDRAVAVYLRLGYYLGDTTILDGVRVLPPASTLVWDGRQTLRSDGRMASRAAFEGTRRDAIAEYDRLFAGAVSARLAPTIGRITLSGGRDSRHILLELHRQGRLPSEALTLARRNSNDHEIARALARSVGIDCVVIENSLDAFEMESRKNRLNSFMSDENGWYLPLVEHLNGPVFDGLAGDVLSNGLYFVREVAALIDQGAFHEAARLFVRCHGGYVSYLSAPARKRFGDELAIESIAEEFARHHGAPNPVQSFVFWNRTRREIAMLPIGMARTRVDPLLPYTDPDLLAFLLSLPHAAFGEKGFHDEVIISAYPGHAQLPYAEKMKPAYGLTERSGYALRASWRLFGGFASKTRVLSYAGQVIRGPGLRALENPFSRLYPLIQAQQELGIET